MPNFVLARHSVSCTTELSDSASTSRAFSAVCLVYKLIYLPPGASPAGAPSKVFCFSTQFKHVSSLLLEIWICFSVAFAPPADRSLALTFDSGERRRYREFSIIGVYGVVPRSYLPGIKYQMEGCGAFELGTHWQP